MRRALTPRQQQVLEILLRDAQTSCKEIAHELGISRDTAQRHVTNIYVVVGVRSRTQLVLWAIRRGKRPRPRWGWLRPMVVEERRGHSEACGCSVCFIRGHAA